MEKKKSYINEKNIKTNELKKELRGVLSLESQDKKEVFKPIIFDGRQFSVRIPKKFADAVQLNPKKDVIKFTLEVQLDRLSSPKLMAEVIKDGKKVV